jgi:hypothetical protein
MQIEEFLQKILKSNKIIINQEEKRNFLQEI